ncbi:MAG: DUF5615 family PIN-like protein [Planctomycetia bacterium]
MPAFRFLADESCDYLVVRTLRSAGHDVMAVVDEQQRSVDEAVIDQAFADSRILLTEDRDFEPHAVDRHILEEHLDPPRIGRAEP